MDPLKQPVAMGPPPFYGADQDAKVLQQRLNDLYNFAPEGSVIQDPARRAKLASSVEHVAELTAQLATLQRVLPGKVMRVVAPLITGVEKDPGTGKLRPGVQTAGNFLPSPLGFLDPTAVGVPRNFYLPSGATNYLPREADRLGIGIPEQRAADTATNAELFRGESLSRVRTAQAAVANESDETLDDIINDRFGFRRSGVIVATKPVNVTVLKVVARMELERRHPPPVVPVPVPVLPDPLPGSVQPEGIRPVNVHGIMNEHTAEHIRRELVAERADP